MARLLDQVYGHKDVIAKLLGTFASERPGQTFLFVGPNGIGKKKIALGLAQALLCETSRTACGRCGSCLRVAANAHESLKVISPEGIQIKIDESREVIQFLNLQGLTSRRVVVIDQAQTLNLQAANSLLKTLEEPPPETYFFLIAPSVASVISTIRSRSRIVSFKPLTAEEISRGAVGAPEWAVRASQGSFEKLAQLQDGPEQDVRSEALSLLQQFIEDKEFLTDNSWRDCFKDRARSQRILSYWVSMLRDVVYFQEDQKKQIMNVDQVEPLKALAQKDQSEILNLLARSLKVESEILQNRDVQLLIEEFWIQTKNQEA
ncbi:ATP-binding protein [Bdellovibrio sp. HCB337]|uniref:DNA polymerase III subunit n=1 Tax=Bdellovibrio sp. HCB337 TaxID=3394358 RepID=UPI0039A65B71